MKKIKFGEEYIVRDHIGIIDVDATLDRIVLNAQGNIRKIVEEEKFDLTEKQIKELCLSVFYARPDMQRTSMETMLMLAINQLDVPARRFNAIHQKMISWVENDCMSKRGSFRYSDGHMIVLRSRERKR